MSKVTLIAAAFTLILGTAAYAADEPVYSVTFDEGSSGYTLINGEGTNLAVMEDGPTGKAVSLKGGAYVKLIDNITTGMSGDYTIAVDVYPREELSFARVFDIGTGTDNTMWFSCYGGSVPKFRFKGNDFLSSGVKPELNKWNHVVITRSGTEARLYINGLVAATSTTFGNDLGVIGETNCNYLGKSQYPNDPYFNGMIDNFNIYDYAVPEKDIIMQYNPRIEASTFYMTRENGVIMTLGEEGVSAVAEIRNYTDEDTKVTLINLEYDEQGKLLDTQTVTADIGAGSVGQMELPVNDADTVKTYLYENTVGIKAVNSICKSNIKFPVSAPADTLETTIGVHDPTIFKDPKSGTYYVYSTGMIDIFKSEDLINWTRTEGTLPELPQCVYDRYDHDTKDQYSNIWAPDMHYNEEDPDTPYYLTCSYSDKFGENNSSIILFKASSPEGPWENGEIIFTSDKSDPKTNTVNAIDSNIVADAASGKKYMAYGSFWEGIHLLELNDNYKVVTDGKGSCIESRFSGIGGPEGAYIIYNPDTKYYYLFTSYDDLSSTYTIRVARSKNITGPYADHTGASVNRFNDNPENANKIFGYKLIGSYQFEGGTTYYAPGHNSVLNDNGEWYLVHHTRVTNGGFATLHVRKMFWTEDGWPVVSPERYAGESIQDIPEAFMCGEWDMIDIGTNTKDMLFSNKLTLNYDGTAVSGDDEGTWSISGNKLKLAIGERFISAYVLAAYDSDMSAPNIVFTGTDENNCAVWGKKSASINILKQSLGE